MLFIRSHRTEPGATRIVYRNSSAATILRGSPVVLDPALVDGVSIVLPTAATLCLLLGVAFEDIAAGAYGQVQNSAWCDYAMVANHTVNATAIGDILVPVAGQAYFQRSAAPDGRPAFALSLEVIAANAVVTAVARKVWLGTGVLGV